MRTTEEIVFRAKEAQAIVLDFTFGVLVEYLPWADARQFFKDDAHAELSEEWEQRSLDRTAIVEEMRDYMTFAWDKAIDHRGISACRSIDKMIAWLWLLGEDDFIAEIKGISFTNYGAPKLARICERFDFPILDDEAARNMANGEPCRPDCDEGCGT